MFIIKSKNKIMFSVDYTLDIRAYQQYFSYQATHDKRIVRLCLTLIIALTFLVFCIVVIINGLNWITVIVSGVALILLALCFPKFYWKIQFKRIDSMVAKMDLTYSPLTLTIDKDGLTIKENGKTIQIKDDQVNKLDFTHDYGFIFYHDHDRPATLIFPIEKLSQDQLQTLIVRY